MTSKKVYYLKQRFTEIKNLIGAEEKSALVFSPMYMITDKAASLSFSHKFSKFLQV